MMLLQYAIWGAWLPLLWPYLANHLGFNGHQIGDMFAVGALGAIIAPFLAGQLADRYFSTEKFLAVSHLAGGVLIWFLASLTTYWQFLAFSFVYSLVYSPTLSLTNSLAFHHLPDRDRDFGQVRIWGTIGWIIVGVSMAQWLFHRYTPEGASANDMVVAQAGGMADAFRLSGILGHRDGLVLFPVAAHATEQGKKEECFSRSDGRNQKEPAADAVSHFHSH